LSPTFLLAQKPDATPKGNQHFAIVLHRFPLISTFLKVKTISINLFGLTGLLCPAYLAGRPHGVRLVLVFGLWRRDAAIHNSVSVVEQPQRRLYADEAMHMRSTKSTSSEKVWELWCKHLQ
jgi:hypothetical protein